MQKMDIYFESKFGNRIVNTLSDGKVICHQINPLIMIMPHGIWIV